MFKVIDGVKTLLTQEELDIRAADRAIWDAAAPQRAYSDAVAQRLSRYQSESDRLFIEWNYTGVAADETKWRDKVAEIKTAIPLPAV